MQSEWKTPLTNKWNALVALCALFGPPAAHAGSTADDLAQLEAEQVVAKARLRLVETQAQIAARQAEIQRQAPLIQNGMPTVAGIEGMVGNLQATLRLENGFLAEVKVGDALPNGMSVASIAPSGVVVRTAANKRVRLKAAGETAMDAPAYIQRGMTPAVPVPYPASPPTMMSMPPLPVPQATPLPSAPRTAVTPGAGR